MLTSLAGGRSGLLKSGDSSSCVDFLTNFPINALNPPVEAIRKEVSFGDETQEFYLGYGSLGVPGNLDGLLYIFDNYCTMELSDILAPSIDFAKGHKVTAFQAITFQILKEYCLYTNKAKEVFAPRGKMLGQGDTIRNMKLARFLEMLAKDENTAMAYYHDQMAAQLESQPSTLSLEDVQSYMVREHDTVEISYRGHEINLTPPPSAGGVLIAHGLKRMEPADVASLGHNSAEHIRLLTDTIKACDSQRTKDFFKGLLFEEGFWQKFIKRPDRLGGTTHISVMDSDGNAAGITTSNGQGSGIMAGDTGIMFNNFAAEPDLMQHKDIYKPGERITSMMSPTIIRKDGELKAILGSGGSNRIRSAITQVISNLIDFGMSPDQAANASRIHYEYDVLQLEHGIDAAVMDELAREYKVNRWTNKNMYFGGVHITTPDGGGGDLRRSGTVAVG
jgi:gamma-glutamyltranspeptidase/glutathione hydrolase